MKCPVCGEEVGNAPTCPFCGAPIIIHLPKNYELHSPDVGKLRVLEVIGQGGFGIVYKVKDNLGNIYALKEFFIQGSTRKNDFSVNLPTSIPEANVSHHLDKFIKEGELLQKISYPSLVKVHSVFRANNTAYILMDFLNGISLRNYIGSQKKPLNEDEFFKLIFNIGSALFQIHRKGYVHRDVSPNNIMKLHDTHGGKYTNFVLLDLGNAKIINTQVSQAVITDGYAPIEAYGFTSDTITKATDIYSFAAVLYFCLTTQDPPPAPSRMVNDTISLNISWLAPELKKLILKGLSISPQNRPDNIGIFINLARQVKRSQPKKVKAKSPSLPANKNIAKRTPRTPANIPPKVKPKTIKSKKQGILSHTLISIANLIDSLGKIWMIFSIMSLLVALLKSCI